MCPREEKPVTQQSTEELLVRFLENQTNINTQTLIAMKALRQMNTYTVFLFLTLAVAFVIHLWLLH